MDVLALIQRARAAGLALSASQERLVVKGPVSAGALARELGRRKTEVLAALAAGNGVYVYTNDSKTAETANCVDVESASPPQLLVAEVPAALEEVDWPPPCPKCGSLEMWWNVLGDVRCLSCDPPRLLPLTKVRHVG